MESQYEQERRLTKYRLTYDLTSYHPKFVVGVVGIEGPNERRGTWGLGQPDRFFPFELPSGECLDVLWQSVERINSTKVETCSHCGCEKVVEIQLAPKPESTPISKPIPKPEPEPEPESWASLQRYQLLVDLEGFTHGTIGILVSEGKHPVFQNAKEQTVTIRPGWVAKCT